MAAQPQASLNRFLNGKWTILPDEANPAPELVVVTQRPDVCHEAIFTKDNGHTDRQVFQIADGGISVNGWALEDASTDKMVLKFSCQGQPPAVWHRTSCDGCTENG